MNPGTIIFINGTSSSGKTSIVHALQDLLEEPYLEAGIDKFIFMMPERYLDRPLWDEVLGLATEAGASGHLLFSGMHRAIRTLAESGINVIADHVFVEQCWVDDCANLFSEMPAYLIGVQCPLEILEERERSRKNRTLGQARAQFEIIHKYCTYDCEVDTSLDTPEKCARQIIERLKSPPQAFKTLKRS